MPNVNHKILSWARETVGLSVEDAAQKLQFTDGKAMSAAEKLLVYEEGKKAPSRPMLLKMSKTYRRPLLTFYLEREPTIGDRGEDFRTLPDDYDSAENVYVDVLIRDIQARQSTIRETLIDEDEAEPLGFVGKHTSEDGIESVVHTIQGILNIDLEEYRNQPNHEDAFRLLRRSAENAGIFVLLKGNLGNYHTNIGVTTFRGFALCDDIAPFVVINDRDAKSAWSFTLLHELAHLVLGETGISGAFAEQKIEKFCNQVASEFLLSSADFSTFKVSEFDLESLSLEISGYAFSMKVSGSHIAYRLYRRGDIDKAAWVELRDFYRQQWINQRGKLKERNREKDGGPNYYVVHRHKLGALVRIVQRLTYSGALTTTKAGMLLDVRPLKVHRLFDPPQPV